MSAEAKPPFDAMLDIPEGLRPVARKHGRDLYMLCVHSGMATEAAAVLSNLGTQTHNRRILHAVQVLAEAFNHCSTALARSQDWDEAKLVQCSKDIERAWASIVVDSPRIVLDH